MKPEEIVLICHQTKAFEVVVLMLVTFMESKSVTNIDKAGRICGEYIFDLAGSLF